MPDLDLRLPDCHDLAELRRLLNEKLGRVAEALRQPVATPPDMLTRRTADLLYEPSGATAAAATRTAGYTATTPSPNAAAAATGPRAIALTVPGTLSVRSSAAPLIALESKAQASGIVALLKQAPLGQDCKLQLWQGSKKWAALTIASGKRQALITGDGLAQLEADTEITLDLVQVGTVFPGADLTVLIRLGGQ